MAGEVLYDAVTLLHFATVGRLDILETRHGHLNAPRWTMAVHDELEAGANQGLTPNQDILAAAWLGAPIAPTTAELSGVFALHVGLNDGRRPPVSHAGEAESIYLAEQLGASFATDDNAAYDFGERRLGVGRVLDTVTVLRDAVAMDELGARDALAIAAAIRSAGRHLRRTHSQVLIVSDFDR